MGFISSLHTKWKDLPTGEKMKIIVEGVCDIGACFLTETLAKNFCKANNCGTIKRLTIGTAMTGLGMWASSTASKQFNGMIDAVYKTPKEEEDDDDE